MSLFELKLLWKKPVFRFKLLLVVLLVGGLWWQFIFKDDHSKESELYTVELDAQISESEKLSLREHYGEDDEQAYLYEQRLNASLKAYDSLIKEDYQTYVEARHRVVDIFLSHMYEQFQLRGGYRFDWAKSFTATEEDNQEFGLKWYRYQEHAFSQLIDQEGLTEDQALFTTSITMLTELFSVFRSWTFIGRYTWHITLLVTLLVSSHLSLSEKRHQSFLEVLPQYKSREAVKTAIGHGTLVTIFEISMFLVVTFIYGMLNEFGDISATTVTFWSGTWNKDYRIIPVFGVLTLCLLILWFFNLLITGLITLFNVLFKEELITMIIISLAILFLPIVNVLGVEGSWMQYNPFSYVEIGNLVWGVQEHFFTEGAFSFREFGISMSIALVSVYLLSYVVISVIEKV
ncbi:hypothetical protein DOPI104051_02335 [Dolosigranulum pigrum]|uniref:Uncharacterized protein n=1 Tax=Dolosigranulum pigrum ATCC 51524 TaxID=883103 RepID=H3NEQ4_9LACT|nr:hypothetical protein [Dolosigranulum pigrum]EHR32919.1 hypothetical protein HMPREF9703_01035 [Dolosigranulum pigrum ATCC 51524]